MTKEATSALPQDTEAEPLTPEDEAHYVGSIFARARKLDFYAYVETMDRERE